MTQCQCHKSMSVTSVASYSVIVLIILRYLLRSQLISLSLSLFMMHPVISLVGSHPAILLHWSASFLTVLGILVRYSNSKYLLSHWNVLQMHHRCVFSQSLQVSEYLGYHQSINSEEISNALEDPSLALRTWIVYSSNRLRVWYLKHSRGSVQPFKIEKRSYS